MRCYQKRGLRAWIRLLAMLLAMLMIGGVLLACREDEPEDKVPEGDPDTPTNPDTGNETPDPEQTGKDETD